MSFLAALSVVSLLRGQEPPKVPAAAAGADYNITLVTDSAPDFTDVQSYLRSITSQYDSPQDKAVAVWRWSQRLRKQTSNPTEGGHYVHDPVRFFTSYGYANCGIVSGVDNALWLNLGWKAHYVQLGDHTVCECSWDGGKTWHMFDNSMSFFCFNDRGEVASVREIEKNPRFYLENFAPGCGTNPVRGLKDHQGWRPGSDAPVHYERSLANGVDSFLPPNDIIADHLAATWGRTYAITLRPGEHYTRHFDRVGPATSDPHYYRPFEGRGEKDVEARNPHKNIRANGAWHYAPDLRNPATRDLVYSDSGVAWTADGVKGPGSVTFKVAAANAITSAKLTVRATGATVSLSCEAGTHWEPVALASGTADLVEQVSGASEYLVKVELAGADSVLTAFSADTITQLNRAALPRLTRGTNQVQVRLGPQVETITLAPSLVGGNHKKTVHAGQSLDVHPQPYFYRATLRAGANGTPCSATWKIEAPTPVVGVTYGGNVCVRSPSDRVTLLHSWDGTTFTQDYRKADGSLPFDQTVNTTVDGVPPGTRDVYLRYQFEAARGGGTWNAPGIQSALMTVHHEPRVKSFTPIEVTYCWVEHRDGGDVERRHTELVTSLAHQYAINVAGYRDPTMKWVRMNLGGHGPDDARGVYGYADGQDVGAGAKPARVRYRWGRNVALGKPYTLEGKQDAANPDEGKDLTDGVIAPPDTYVSKRYVPTNVMFARDVSPVATIDLGQTETVAAVQVHAGQSGTDFRLTYPDEIVVETSADGKTFTRAGTAGFRQVFDPPADFVPWEGDDSTVLRHLPAGGRLAYAYRILFEKPATARYVRVACACRKGWGVMLSEIQAFDSVAVDATLPPAVVLPPLKPEK